MVGQTVSHYQILDKLGEGGMGVVYKATDTRLDRPVALKFLPPHVSSDSEELHRFTQEAKAAASLNHPNICTIHGLEESDGKHFIVMEFVEGETLDRVKSAMPVHQVLDVAIQAAEGLRAAHGNRIVHRDIKSSNIMVTSEGQVKIMDFGLAKSAAASMVTKTGTTVGTVPFMSPEQARGDAVDRRTDIWSLGVVLYQVIAGRLPFEGEYSEALIYMILNENPPPLSTLRNDTPPELESIIRKCLEKDRDRRYQHMEEMLVDLHKLRGTPIAADLSWSIVREKLLTPRVAMMAFGVVLLALVLFLSLQTLLDSSDIIESIAVLPLENLSGDPEQDYLAAGLHEALITDLGKLTGFQRVIARASVKRFQNTMLSTREISRELGVDALLTGSVLRSGNRVQVTAHLIRASSEDPMWSERFEREFKDVLSLQNEIVGTLARAIQLQLTPGEQSQLQTASEVDPDAYEAYLKGRFEIMKQTPEAFEKSKQYFYAALEIDPDFALAYAGLAFAWLMIGDSGYQPPGETFPRGKELLDKALELDSTSAEAYYYRATIQAAIDWDWAGAEAAFREALRINPNHADARYFFADLLIVLGRSDEWEQEITRGHDLDPLNDFKRSFYGWHLNYLGRYDEAIPIFLELRETGPNKASNHLGLWGAYFRKGMFSEAAASARDYFTEIGDTEFADAVGSPSDESEYQAAMKRTGEVMAERSKERHVPAIRIARMFAHGDDTDKAIEWLEIAYDAHESPLMRLGVFWDWDGLREDPRFQDLLRRVNLPAE